MRKPYNVKYQSIRYLKLYIKEAGHTNSMQPFTKQIKSGAHLFHENDYSRELYIIQSGTIKVYRQLGNKEVELARLEKGAVLGEMALIDGKPRSASAKALTDVTAILVDADAFESKIKGVHPWFLTIVKMISNKIRKADRNLQTVHSGNRSIAVILALCYLARRSGKCLGGESIELDLTATKRQLIQLLGLTHKVVMQAIDFLHEQKLLELKEQTFIIPDTLRFTHYCTFLRSHAKKLFERIEPLKGDCIAVVNAVTRAKPDLITSDAKSVDIMGEELQTILTAAGIETAIAATLLECKARGLLFYNKKDGGDKNDNPCAGILFSLDSAQWKKHYLYSSFSTLIPPV